MSDWAIAVEAMNDCEAMQLMVDYWGIQNEQLNKERLAGLSAYERVKDGGTEMTDIVEMLRNENWKWTVPGALRLEAADEIDRLRKELNHVHTQRRKPMETCAGCQKPILMDEASYYVKEPDADIGKTYHTRCGNPYDTKGDNERLRAALHRAAAGFAVVVYAANNAGMTSIAGHAAEHREMAKDAASAYGQKQPEY